MRTKTGILLMMSCFFLMCGDSIAQEKLVNDSAPVKVSYQIKSTMVGATWTTATATLKGAVTESMMTNQLSSRHPRFEVRILGVSNGRNVLFNVKYQFKAASSSSWTSSSTVLTNSLNESMARNQLLAKNPTYDIRILSMVKK